VGGNSVSPPYFYLPTPSLLTDKRGDSPGNHKRPSQNRYDLLKNLSGTDFPLNTTCGTVVHTAHAFQFGWLEDGIRRFQILQQDARCRRFILVQYDSNQCPAKILSSAPRT